MANNYTEFHETLIVDEGDIKWLKTRIANFNNPPSKEEIDREDYLRVAESYELDPDEPLLFEVKFDGREATFYTKESGIPFHVARLVQELFVARRPEGRFKISYAGTSAKSSGPYWGGAMFVTADRIEKFDTWDFLEEKEKAWREKVR